MEQKVPLVYFFSSLPSRYLATWPVYIIGDNPRELSFTVAVDDMQFLLRVKEEGIERDVMHDLAVIDRRKYITAIFQKRLHQRHFHDIVLDAYRYRGACCQLRHDELLEAAHIIPDKEPEGLPIVTNGLAMCKLHHAAFDSHIIGISPDYNIHVREDVLKEDLVTELYGLDKATFNGHLGGVELTANPAGIPVFVVSGAGTGAGVYRALTKHGFTIFTGILFENDIDYHIARAVRANIVESRIFSEISQDVFLKAQRLMEDTEKVIDTGFPIGAINQPNIELLIRVKPSSLCVVRRRRNLFMALALHG